MILFTFLYYFEAHFRDIVSFDPYITSMRKYNLHLENENLQVQGDESSHYRLHSKLGEGEAGGVAAAESAQHVGSPEFLLSNHTVHATARQQNQHRRKQRQELSALTMRDSYGTSWEG